MLTVHQNVKQFSCAQCEMVFGAKQTLERHIVACMRKKFKKQKVTDEGPESNIMDFCKVEMTESDEDQEELNQCNDGLSNSN